MTITEEIDIDIEGKTLVYSPSQIPKFSSEDGCLLNLAPERTYKLSDSELSSDDEELKNFEQQSYNTTATFVSSLPNDDKIERMKREFIALTSNSNKDPLEYENVGKLKKLLYKGDKELLENNSCGDILLVGSDYQPLRDDYNIIHRRFEKSKKNFNDLINDKESFPENLFENKIFKRTIYPGINPLVTESSMIIYNCACWTEGTIEPYDSTWLRRSTYITDLSSDSVLPGIRELLLSMRKQEWCEAMILPEAAFGKLGVAPRIPSNAIIYCVIEIVNVILKDKISILSYNPKASLEDENLTFEDFFYAGNEARVRGNYYLENKQFKIAMTRYKSGIRILEALTYKNEIEEKRAQDLLVKLFTNCAKCANSLGLPRVALSMCKQASMIDDSNPKIYWQRLQAWKKKGHFDLALKVARRATVLFSNDKQSLRYFQHEQEVLQSCIKKDIDDSNRLYRLMSRAVI